MFNHLLDLLFPRHSLMGREGEWITEEERRQLRSFPVVHETLVLRARGLKHIDRIVAAGSFKESTLLRTAIHTWKYRRVIPLTEELGRLLVEASSLLMVRERPVVCPVPLHWLRKFSRGCNQAELLAEVLSRERGWQLLHLLRRVRLGRQVSAQDRRERFEGVDGAFVMRPSALIALSSVLLIDDVSTSGATLDACAEALKKGGVLRVEGLVLAQG
jgi:ComF family protein